MAESVAKFVLSDLLARVIPGNPEPELCPPPLNKRARLTEPKPNLARTKTDDALAKFNREKIPDPTKTLKNMSRFDVTRKLAELKADRDHWKKLCETSRSQTAHESQARRELQRNLEMMEQNLSEQTDFCNQMGSHLAEVIWTLTQSSNAISHHMKENQMESLLMLIHGTLDNFLEATANKNRPTDGEKFSVSDAESRLVIALVGCAANLAGNSDGRRFVALNPLGDEMNKSMSKILLNDLEQLPTTVQDKLQRLAFCYFYNLTIDRATTKKIGEMKEVAKKIGFVAKNSLSQHQKSAAAIVERIAAGQKFAAVCETEVLQTEKNAEP